MLKLDYNNKQKRRASTLLSLGLSSLEAGEVLVEEGLHKEALVHLYFCCFYISQALLVKHVAPNPSHKNLETRLHRIYGKAQQFPRRYVDVHTLLHKLRNEFDYKVSYSPQPKLIEQKLRVLQAYVAFALKNVPKVDTSELLDDILSENPLDIRDFSYDVYCPKTYAHHTRLTFWQPPFYLGIFTALQLQTQARRLLQNLRVKRSSDYVVGLNSRLNQYGDAHLIMLDIDSLDASVEAHLSKIGGFLLRSGRGFHFIGKSVVKGKGAWEKAMRKLTRNKDLQPYLDRDHIDISLRRGYATLRITTSRVKPVSPVFFKEL